MQKVFVFLSFDDFQFRINRQFLKVAAIHLIRSKVWLVTDQRLVQVSALLMLTMLLVTTYWILYSKDL